MSTNDTELQRWELLAARQGLMPQELRTARTVAALLSGARAIAVDRLSQPSEAAVLAVFGELCIRTSAPSEAPDHAMH